MPLSRDTRSNSKVYVTSILGVNISLRIQEIEKLINIMGLKGPSPLDWVTWATPAGAAVHTEGCPDAEGFKDVELTLAQILEFKDLHSCLDDFFFFTEGHCEFTPRNILHSLRTVAEFPSWEIVMSLNTVEEADDFYVKFSAFIDSFLEDGASEVDDLVSQWLHVNAGYPLEIQDIIELYTARVKEALDMTEVLSRCLKDALRCKDYSWLKDNFPGIDLTDPQLAEGAGALNYHHSQIEHDGTRFIAWLPSHHPPGVRSFISPDDIAIATEIQRLNPNAGDLIALPALLEAAAALEGVVRLPKSKSLKLNFSPTPEELKTAEFLHSKGLPLDKAFESVSKLT